MTRARPPRTSGGGKFAKTPAPLDCATAFQKIALDCIARVKANQGGARIGDAEAVHQIRVAFTQLRAVVSFFAPITAEAKWAHLKKEIEWLNASLGTARDSDVMVAYARHKRYRAWAERGIGLGLDKRQTRDHRRLARCLDSRRFQALIDAISVWIERGPWRRRWERKARCKPAMPAGTYCKRRLNRWRQRLIRKGRRLESLGVSRRHRLRIKAKRFRYMLEALAGIVAARNRGEFHRLHEATKRLQGALGDLRDLERFGELGVSVKGGGAAKKPPDYRRHRKKLLHATVEAYRSLKQAGRF